MPANPSNNAAPPNNNAAKTADQANNPALNPVPKLRIPLIQSVSNHTISITDSPNASPIVEKTGERSIAVAIKHDVGDVPNVVASGYGKTAEKILQLAYEAGVKVRQDGDLAQVLAAVEIDSPIPISCFEAVAEILNYLYKLNATPPQFSR